MVPRPCPISVECLPQVGKHKCHSTNHSHFIRLVVDLWLLFGGLVHPLAMHPLFLSLLLLNVPKVVGDVLQESMLANHFLCNPSDHGACRDKKREDKFRVLFNSSKNYMLSTMERVWCIVTTWWFSEAHRSGIHSAREWLEPLCWEEVITIGPHVTSDLILWQLNYRPLFKPWAGEGLRMADVDWMHHSAQFVAKCFFCGGKWQIWHGSQKSHI